MDIGARIRYFRERKNITVNKLANISGVSQSYLRDVELNNKQPTVEYLEYICFGLGITLKDFFSTDEPQNEFEQAVSKLTPEQKELLIKFINSL
ncbi:MAG: helix-turn-helix transcriptional regulator [Clostridia bacterium]|nr:helix-turn-helix transcriptional regulator [Clostridia bacterium]